MSFADSFLADLMSDDEGDMPMKQEDVQVNSSSSSSSSLTPSSDIKTELSEPSLSKPCAVVTPMIVSDLLSQQEVQHTLIQLECAIAEAEAEQRETQAVSERSMAGASGVLQLLRQGEQDSSDSDSDSDSSDSDDVDSPSLEELGIDTSVVDVDGQQALINSANTLSRDLDLELTRVSNKVKAIYANKFPELSDIVPNVEDYVRCVRLIGNASDVSHLEKRLQGFLSNAVVLTISVTTASTKTRSLSEDDLAAVTSGCDAVDSLQRHLSTVSRFLECQVTRIAPNLAAIVTPPVAARLLGVAGGLRQLLKVPSCNLQVLGASKHALAGMSVAHSDIHVGVLGLSPVMQHIPLTLRRKTLRLLAGKCSLAIRLDATGNHRDGLKGREFAKLIEAKVNKWQEPPPSRLHKPLPRPDEVKKKKRGGRKARLIKERQAQSELAKQKNRVMFGQAEVVDEFTGEEMGMIGQQGSGILRIKQSENQKLQNRLSKKMKGRLAAGAGNGANVHSFNAATSAFSMTSDQGLELSRSSTINDNATLKKHDYFSQHSGFTRVRKHEDDGGGQDSKKPRP